MPKMTEIYLVRHGETDHNLDESLPNNIPLNTKGRNQAEKTGKYLKQYNKNPKADAMISSQLIRTIETSDIIAEEIGYKGEIERLKILNEFNWDVPPEDGKKIMDKANKQFKEYEEKYKNDPIGYYKNRMSMYTTFEASVKIPTRIKQSFTRMNKFLDNLAKTKHKKIVIVAHGGIIAIIAALITGLPPYEPPKGKGEKPRGNCNITYITLKDGEYTIVGPMSTSHLE